MEQPMQGMAKKKFNLTYDEDEINDKIANLQASQLIDLFLKVEKGKKEYQELLALIDVVKRNEQM